MAKENFIPRDQLTEEQLAEALKTCAEEPIHIPNLIQPHGAMLVVDQITDTICQVSANTEDFLGYHPNDMVGRKLTDFVTAEQFAKINSAVRVSDLQPLKGVLLTIDGQQFNAAIHLSEGNKVIELEKNTLTEKESLRHETLADLVRDFSVEAHNIGSSEKLYNLLVSTVREITGFDRVKLYRFDEDWNGAIVAEDRADFMPSYLGLTFPASDIPEQARKLYSRNFLRLIADISYKPIYMVPPSITPGRKPIDMSYSVLRSVSPIHIQYLDNIGVKASMSVSIMQKGKLWGLVACHHSKPHWISYQDRVLAEAMGHIFSAKLSSIESQDERRRTEQKATIIEKLSLQLNKKIDLGEILNDHSGIALDALSAQGLAIRTGNKVYAYGNTPHKNILDALFDVCLTHIEDGILYTRDAENFLKSRNAFLNITGGFLAVPIGHLKHDIAIWFRDEKTREVFWAGNPEKPVEQTMAGYRLTPRASFELWKTTTKGKSEIWSKSDIETSTSIAQIILENEKIYAERSNSAKSDFLSHMSHELRTPLSAVLGISQILSRDTTLTPKQKDLISTLDVSASSLLALINDLLDISKIEANQVVLETIPFNVKEMIGEVSMMMEIKAKEKRIAFNVNIDENVPLSLIGDPGKIKQVLINLISNALKFTEKGFVNLSFSLNRIENNTAHVIFEVADSGIGIAPGKIDSVFDRFAQADPSITRRYGGTGLGLSITKSIVTALGGTIEVKSQEGFGSRFIAHLPLQASEAFNPVKVQSVQAQALPVVLDAPRILLVEDQENNILVANFFLDDRGFKVTIAYNGQEALEILEKQTFDLIIMDIQMPIMDGLTATRKIRERETLNRSKRTPILAMTANALKEDRQICLDAGMDDYVSKPIDVTRMNEKIDLLLGND